MEFSLIFILKSLFLGLLSGYFSGQFGLGGGLITTPGIRLFLGQSAAYALGTPLLVMIPATMTAALAYHKKNLVDPLIARYLIISGMMGIFIGAFMTAFVMLDLLMLATAVIILGVGLTFLLKPQAKVLTKEGSHDHNGVDDVYSNLNGGSHSADPRIDQVVGLEKNHGLSLRVKCFLAGSVIGFYSGSLGMGGGILLVPLLVYVFRFGIKKAFGTSLVINLFYAIPGTVIHYHLGHVNVGMALWLILGVIPGAYLGAKVSIGLNENILRRMFGTFLCVVAGYFLFFEARLFI